MELVSLLRILTRRPWLLLAGLLAASAVGIALNWRVSIQPLRLEGRSVMEISASGRVILDVPAAPAVDLASNVSDTVSLRASLVADLLSADPVRGRIAVSSGLLDEEMAVLTPAGEQAPVEVPLAREATQAAKLIREPVLLRATAAERVPTITLQAFAPSTSQAAAVVRAATRAVQDIVRTRAGGDRGLSVTALPITNLERTINHSPGVAIAAAVFLFVAWCSAIVCAVGLRRRRRRGAPHAS